ncbi:MAG: aminotransferase class V-fold PLP-dependent enzyme [Bacteroidota bacterium]
MIYLNNAATTWPKPKDVLEAVNECMATPPGNHARMGLEAESEDIITSTRQKLAKLFNTDDILQIVFTSGSTEALNLALRGLDLKGRHVVSTSIEHNSVIRPLKTMEQEGIITLDFAPCDYGGYVSPDAIDALITDNTAAVVVNHCSNVTGAVLDLKAISDVAHKRGCYFIVDASQSAGTLPIDLTNWNIDLLAFTGHKSLYGLPGSGGLYINKDITLKPLKVGGTGVKSEELLQPREMPLYCEAGTPNMPGIVSLNAGCGWIEKTGMDNIHTKKKRYWQYIFDELTQLEPVKVYYSKDHNSYSNFCFNIGDMVPDEVNYILESSYDMQVRSGLHCAPLILHHIGVHPWGTVRASSSYFTPEIEVEKFIDAIKEIVRTFVR